MKRTGINLGREKEYVCGYCGEKYSSTVRANAARKPVNKKKPCGKEKCKDQYFADLYGKNKESKKGLNPFTKSRSEKSNLEAELQHIISKIVMKLDENFNCLAGSKGREFEAGHVIPVAVNVAFRFNVWNIHKQEKYSNRRREDEEMQNGFIDRYSLEIWNEQIREAIKKYRILKLSKPELREYIKNAKDVLRLLNEGRILSRTEINNKIGIYLQ